jgi:hypothetical protein
MVIDTSAIIAILFGEPEAERFAPFPRTDVESFQTGRALEPRGGGPPVGHAPATPEVTIRRA